MAGVLEGADGYLFLTDDSNRLIDQMTGGFLVPDEELDAIAAVHAARHAMARDIGASYRHIIAPNKEQALSALLPAPLRDALRPELAPVRRYLARLPASANTFYDADYLTALNVKSQMYARQDTHWTHVGAHQYFHRALQAMAPPAEYEAFKTLPFRRSAHYNTGDLGVMAGREPELLPSVVLHKMKPRLRLDNDIPNLGHVRLYANPAAPTRLRALVFHDSVANWLVAQLSGLYREALLVHLPDMDLDFARKYRPDVIYAFQIERFFIRPPQDGLDLIAEVGRQEAEKAAPRSAAPLLAGIARQGPWEAGMRRWLRQRMP